MAEMLQSDALSYSEFCTLDAKDDVRREFYNGVTVNMAPASAWHQGVVRSINRAMDVYFKGKSCIPWDGRGVHLALDAGDRYYIPDVLVLCDSSKDDGQTIEGAPDLVVEVWSPSNSRSERGRKISDYMDAGVREIWEIIHGDGSDVRDLCIMHTRQDSDGYLTQFYYTSEPVPSFVFPGLTVVFEQ